MKRSFGRRCAPGAHTSRPCTGPATATALTTVLLLTIGCSAPEEDGESTFGPRPEDLPSETVSLLVVDPPDRYDAEIEKAAIRRVVNEIDDRSSYYIDITYVPAGSNEEYESAVLDVLQQGTPPDLIYLHDGELARDQVESGRFVALDEYLPSFAPEYYDGLSESVRRVNGFSGHLVGIPVEIPVQYGYFLSRPYLELPRELSASDFLASVAERRKRGRPYIGIISPPTHPARSVLDYPDNAATFIEFQLAVEHGVRPIPGIETLLFYHDFDSDTVLSLIDRIPESLVDAVMEIKSYLADDTFVMFRGHGGPGSAERSTLGNPLRTPAYYRLLAGESMWAGALYPMHYFAYTNVVSQLRNEPPSAEFPGDLVLSRPTPVRSVSGRALDFLFVPREHGDRVPVIISCIETLHGEGMYELCNYGIEGLHWKPSGEGEFTPVEEPIWTLSVGSSGGESRTVEYPRPVFPTRRPHNPLALLAADQKRERVDARLPERTKAVIRSVTMEYDTHPIDPVSGFVPDLSDLRDRIASILAEHRTTYLRMLTGEIDILESIAAVERMSGPEIREIRDELRRQYEAYRAHGDTADGTDPADRTAE